MAEDPEDPFLRALAAAPLDDEPETAEEAEAVRLAIEEADRGGSSLGGGEAPSTGGPVKPWSLAITTRAAKEMESIPKRNRETIISQSMTSALTRLLRTSRS